MSMSTAAGRAGSGSRVLDIGVQAWAALLAEGEVPWAALEPRTAARASQLTSGCVVLRLRGRDKQWRGGDSGGSNGSDSDTWGEDEQVAGAAWKMAGGLRLTMTKEERGAVCDKLGLDLGALQGAAAARSGSESEPASELQSDQD